MGNYVLNLTNLGPANDTLTTSTILTLGGCSKRGYGPARDPGDPGMMSPSTRFRYKLAMPSTPMSR